MYKLKIKIAVSCSIFLLLLTAAWYLQEHNHREFNPINSNSPNMVTINNEITTLNTNLSTKKASLQWEFFEPFKPREYVRIIEK